MISDERFTEYRNINGVEPVNIPLQLRGLEFSKRRTDIIKSESPVIYPEDLKIFVKDNLQIKGYCEFVGKGDTYPAGEFLISEVINIESEWRAFVFNKTLMGLQNYSRDFTMFPDVSLIKKMIETYTDCCPAYTLDVGINQKDGTFVIEVHDMFSVGLYGFDDKFNLVRMFHQGYKYLLRKYAK